LKKKFFSNLLLLVTLNLLVKPFWIFGIDRSVQNVVGAEEYGLYFSLFSFSMLLNILLDAGTTNYNNRVIARDPRRLSEYFSQLFLIRLLLAVVYAGVTFSVAWMIGYRGRQMHLLTFLVLNQFLASLILFLRSNVTGLHLFRTDSLLSVADRTLMILFTGVVLWGHLFGGTFRIEWFVYIQTLSYLLVAVVAFGVVRRRCEYFRPRFHRELFMKILRESFPFAVLTILMSLYYRVDSVMLERMLPGAREAGIYAQAFRLLDAFAMFAYLFAVILLPLFSRMFKEERSVTELVRFAFLLLMVPVIVLSVGVAAYREGVMDLLYVSHQRQSAQVLALLMGALVFVSSGYIFGTLLTARGDISFLSRLSAVGFVVNVVLNFFLIPRYQAVGAAWASLLTQSAIGAGQILLVRKRLRTPLSDLIPRKMWFFTGIAVVLAVVIRKSGIPFQYGFPAYLAVMLAGAALTELLPVRHMKTILQEEEE